MFRPAHRLLMPLAVLGLLAGLTACGDDPAEEPSAVVDSAPSPGESTSAAPGDVTPGDVPEGIDVTGKVGAEPKVTWDAEVTVAETVVSVLAEGDGAEVKSGDSLLAQIWIGNGTTKAKAYSTYTERPQLLPLTPQMLPALTTGLVGRTIGSRVLIAAPPKDAYGEQGNQGLNIGNADTTVFVIDLLDTLPTGPEGDERKPATWAPDITEADGNPTALDFDGAPKPTGKLLSTTLIEGTGKPTTKGQHLYVNYLGQVYGGDKPFDESYSRGAPFDFDLGAGAVVRGWDQGLVGVKVGSRVLLQIPPGLGYGKDGQPDVGIGPTDTMYFIVDVLAAS